MSKYIIDDIELSSDFDREHSDEEYSNEKSLKNTYMIKLIFKACETFFYNFFSTYRNVNRILSKKTKKALIKSS